ncbi:MAG: hypothetical protein D6734_03155 [Candidatus Schekmanbacteria bacterium]|nr:MAG: hypothetical protein D6734_03155 [Candidatus Schekmanbacteria bacterium]
MYTKAINEKTKSLLAKIRSLRFVSDFYLAGGTSLAIQIGHRQSIDLDFFSKGSFSVPDIRKELSNLGEYIVVYEDNRTLDIVLDEVKVSFFHYDYDLLYPLIDFENIKLADIRDIAAMKISAISSRGCKKDFIDLFFLLEKYSLEELLSFFEKKYSKTKYNKMHILKSLVFFDDAEEEPMPVMLKSVDWKNIKKKIIIEVRNYPEIEK